MWCDPCFWAAAASRFLILTLATMVLEVDEQPFPPTCIEHVSVDSNFFFRRRINLFKVFCWYFLPWPWYLLSALRSGSSFISCLRHTKIQHLADFEPQLEDLPEFWPFTQAQTFFFFLSILYHVLCLNERHSWLGHWFSFWGQK